MLVLGTDASPLLVSCTIGYLGLLGYRIYGHENEMYKEPMNLKRGKGVYMRELRECGGRTEDKTKCAKG